MQSHRLKTPFSEKKAQILQSARIEPPPVAIKYLKSVKRPKSGMQSHRLKTPFSEKKAQILQSLTQICRN